MAKWTTGHYCYVPDSSRWWSLELSGLGRMSVQQTNEGSWWWCWDRRGPVATKLDPKEYKSAAAAKRAAEKWAHDMVKQIRHNLEAT
jgi:hypothetical protein